jgi:uncharacterized protein YndB with AHSA1/START domain
LEDYDDMAMISVSTHIARPIEDVFAYVTDLRTEPLWDSAVRVAEVESGGPLRVGARVHNVRSVMGRAVETFNEITAYEPPRAFGFHGDVPFPVRGGYRFTPEGSGTRIEFYSEAELRGVLGLLAPLTTRVFAAQMRARFVTLKALLEASEPATARPGGFARQ